MMVDNIAKTQRNRTFTLWPRKPLNILGVCVCVCVCVRACVRACVRVCVSDVTVEPNPSSTVIISIFHVVKGAHGSLILFNNAQELGLVNIVNKINAEWEEEYLGLIKGIGKLNNTVFLFKAWW